jgi:hypothetical protein
MLYMIVNLSTVNANIRHGAMMSTRAWSIKSWLMEKWRDIQSPTFCAPLMTH